MAAESEAELEFRSWMATAGEYVGVCRVVVNGDMRPDNDADTTEFWVARTDVAVRAIVAPTETIPAGNVTPRIVLANLGEEPCDAWLRCRITDADSAQVYADSLLIASLGTGAETLAVMRSWAATAGSYRLSAHAASEGDENPGNDTLSVIVTVESLLVRRWEELAPLPIGSSAAGPRAGACLVGAGSYVFALNSAKTSATKVARIVKYRDKILAGKGALDR